MEKIKFLLPDLLTGINICIGFVCIILVLQAPRVTGTFHQNHIVSAWLIVIAAVIDALDGMLARRFGKPGTFGIELDSLSDLTVFAIAPSTLLYACFYQGNSVFFVLVPLSYLVAAAYRLARYNINALHALRKQLIGLTTTISAIIVVGVVLLVAKFYQLGAIQEVSWGTRGIITGLVLVNSSLMVSTIEFITLDEYCFRDKKHIILPVVAVFAPLLLLRFKILGVSVLMVGLFYVVESIGRWLLGTRPAQTKNKF